MSYCGSNKNTKKLIFFTVKNKFNKSIFYIEMTLLKG
jgi:hypothetical protein